MKDIELGDYIKTKCAEYCEIPADQIALDAKIMGTYDLTSLDFLSLLSDVEEEYNIEIQDEEILEVESLADLITIIEGKIK
jgi:acyl carrier protein